MYVYYCRTYDKAVSGGGRGKREVRRGYEAPFFLVYVVVYV